MDHCSDSQHMCAEGERGVRDGQMEGEKDRGVEEGEMRATVAKGSLCFDGERVQWQRKSPLLEVFYLFLNFT